MLVHLHHLSVKCDVSVRKQSEAVEHEVVVSLMQGQYTARKTMRGFAVSAGHFERVAWRVATSGGTAVGPEDARQITGFPFDMVV